MALYTYAGPFSRHDGTTELKVASGFMMIGETKDVTAGELTILSGAYDLRVGTVGVTLGPERFKMPKR